MSAKKFKAEKRLVEKLEIPAGFGETSKQWIEQHQAKLIGVAVGVFVVAAAIWGYNAYMESKEKRAQADYARIVQNWPGSEDPPSQALEKMAGELETMVKEHGTTSAARNAALDLAKVYYQMGRLGEALKWNSQLLERVASDQRLKMLVHYQLALIYEALGKVDEARAEWLFLQADGIRGLGRELQWRLGKAYFLKGDYPQAIEHLEKALQSEGNYPAEPLLQSEVAHARAVSGLQVQKEKSGSTEAAN